MGGVRMLVFFDIGVIDENLKVYLIDNLFVVGVVVYLIIGFLNSIFIVLVLGLCLVNYLKDK